MPRHDGVHVLPRRPLLLHHGGQLLGRGALAIGLQALRVAEAFHLGGLVLAGLAGLQLAALGSFAQGFAFGPRHGYGAALVLVPLIKAVTVLPSLFGLDFPARFIKGLVQPFGIMGAVGFWMYPICHYVHVEILGVGVRHGHILMLGHTEFFHGVIHCLFPLLTARVFVLLPGQNQMQNRVFASLVFF